jgi:hypothetical protein
MMQKSTTLTTIFRVKSATFTMILRVKKCHFHDHFRGNNGTSPRISGTHGPSTPAKSAKTKKQTEWHFRTVTRFVYLFGIKQQQQMKIMQIQKKNLISKSSLLA